MERDNLHAHIFDAVRDPLVVIDGEGVVAWPPRCACSISPRATRRFTRAPSGFDPTSARGDGARRRSAMSGSPS
jgi:hypothetical protein